MNDSNFISRNYDYLKKQWQHIDLNYLTEYSTAYENFFIFYLRIFKEFFEFKINLIGYSRGGVLATHDLFYNKELAQYVITWATINSPLIGGLPFKIFEIKNEIYEKFNLSRSISCIDKAKNCISHLLLAN